MCVSIVSSLAENIFNKISQYGTMYGLARKIVAGEDTVGYMC